MKHPTFLILILFLLIPVTGLANGDDATRNEVAKKLKATALKKLKNKDLNGFCDIFIEMEYGHKYGHVVKVTSTGSSLYCAKVKKFIDKRTRYKYEYPEKIIHLHISS
ncbi:hypothetical protein ACQEXU_13155 [Vibrio sp. TRT 21S02]|uniref:hypothetical protein n=1 Tax=Vibrio sp. TRT 21S02 TaxID=3418507 RepID=UPI003CF55742